MAKAARAVAVLILGLCLCSLPAFVPGPGRFARVAPAAVGAGALGMLGAAPAYADKIDDAAKVLSEKSYPFLKEIDWTSDVYGKLPTQNALDVLKAINPHFEGKPCNATPLQGFLREISSRPCLLGS